MSGVKQNIKTFDLDSDTVEEIISILAQHGRPDLITKLRKSRDDDYMITKKEKKIKEYYEYYEDYNTDDEDYTSSDVSVDSNGFWSLK